MGFKEQTSITAKPEVAGAVATTWQTVIVHFKDGTSDRLETGDPDAADLAIVAWRLDPRTKAIVRQVGDLPAEVVYRAETP